MKKILMMASVMMLGMMSLQAAGTAANTDINNTATLSFDVGGTAQTDVTSNKDTFKVDRKIDLIIDATNTPLDVAAGATDQNLSFRITNEGNDHETFDLGGKYDVAGDDFDPTSCKITDTAGTTISSVDLDADANVTVYISCNIPALGTVHDDDNGTVYIEANTTRSNDSGNADVAGTVQNVFADDNGGVWSDGDHDGRYATSGTYHVKTAVLDATKTSCVLSDPTGEAKPKRIPGAVIRYAIDINNTGSDDASNVVLTDPVASQYGTSAANLEVRSGTCPAVANPCAAKTGSAEAVGGTTGAGTNTVTLDYATVESNSHNCGYFEVTIQ